MAPSIRLPGEDWRTLPGGASHGVPQGASHGAPAHCCRRRRYGNLCGMKIVVCIKHVPDLQSERRLEECRLVRGEDDVLNELDENAVEAAL